jgi:AcrR family transcriptional regulator
VTDGTAAAGAPSATRRYAGQTSDERRETRRRQLLDAGLELFGTAGYAPTTIDQVCAGARVSLRAFYESFASREELLRAVYDEVVEIGLSQVRAAVEAAPDEPAERLRRGLDAFLHAMLDDPRRARVQTVETVGVSAALTAHRRRVIHVYVDLVAAEAGRYVADGRVPARDLPLTALALVGGVNELVVDWLHGDAAARPAIDHVVRELAGMYLGADRPGPGRQ